jgi:hypothetical protein
MKSKPFRKPGFALNREDYIDHLRRLIHLPLCYFLQARLRQAEDHDGLLLWWNSEVRRLIDLQIPSWLSIASTNGRFKLTAAIEEAINQLENRTDHLWASVTKKRAEDVAAHPSTLVLPDRQRLEAEFFSWIRRNCAAIQDFSTDRMPARSDGVLAVWDHVSSALTYCFEIEIATANQYLTHLVWWEDRGGHFS